MHPDFPSNITLIYLYHP